MQGPGSPGTTRHLLEGVLAVARRWTPAGPPPPPMTPSRWAWRLVGLYETTHVTPAAMAQAAETLERGGRPTLAAWARAKTRDEAGHDRLALRDLAALGYDAQALVAAVHTPRGQGLADWLRTCVASPDPAVVVGAAGYAFCLERLAMQVDRRAIDAVRAILPSGVDATRCLRVHSGLGSDADHVDDLVRAVAALDASDRTRVALATREVGHLCFRSPAGGHPTNDALRAHLGGFLKREES